MQNVSFKQAIPVGPGSGVNRPGKREYINPEVHCVRPRAGKIDSGKRIWKTHD